MNNHNHKINCKVKNCCHNKNGCECDKNCVLIETDENGGTCCCSFEE